MSVNRTMGITQIHDLGRSEDPEAVLSNVDVKLFVLGSGIQDFLVFLECFAMFTTLAFQCKGSLRAGTPFEESCR